MTLPRYVWCSLCCAKRNDPSVGQRTRVPGNHAVRYAPQLELVKRAAAVVTHAGLNTTLESLAEGVPLVAIPQGNDQPGVAARIAHHGAGVVVPLEGVAP